MHGSKCNGNGDALICTDCIVNGRTRNSIASTAKRDYDGDHRIEVRTRDAEPEPEPEPEPPEPTHFGRSRSRSRSRRNGLLGAGAGAGAVKMGRLRLRKGIQLWQEKNSSKIKRNSRAKSLPKFVINN